jgi:LytS/YehU family sensor histidine kinase
MIWCLAWVILAAGQASVIHFIYGSTMDIAAADGIISMLLYGLLGLSIWFPVRYMFRSNNKVSSTIINVVLTGSVTIVLWLLATRVLVRAIVPDKEDYDLFWHTVLIVRIAAGVLIFFVVTLIYYLSLSATQLAEKASRQAQLEAQVREGELKMLRAQINPHFLFNSLNSMSSLTLTDPMKAREMILKLSDFMRYSLSTRTEQPVTLQSEMESLRLYLEIEKVRFGERLIIEEEIQPECLTVLLPGMLLQPLYENAVKHGVYESTDTVVIKTTAKKEAENVVISVTNTIDPESVVTRKGAGIGLVNVRSRLELFFGEKANLDVNRKDDSFNVVVKIPYKEK